MSQPPNHQDSKGNRFIDAGRKKQSSSFFVQCVRLSRANRKWWLLPLLLVMIGLALFIALSGSAAAPFIYTLF